MRRAIAASCAALAMAVVPEGDSRRIVWTAENMGRVRLKPREI